MYAIGMLGSDQSIRMLNEAFKKQGITLEARDFVTWEEITGFLLQNPDTAAVIIVERLSLVDGRENFIMKIREVDPDVRIIWCSGKDKRDTEFENWCYRQKVYDFFYPDKSGSYNVTEMGNCINKGRVTIKEEEVSGKQGKDNKLKNIFGKYGSGGSAKNRSNPEPVIKEIIVEKPVEVIREVYVDKPVETVYVEKPIEVIRNVVVEKPVISGLITIAVYALTAGAGATSMVVALAECLAGFGKTAAVGVDGTNDLSYVKGKADYYVLTKDDEIASAMYELTHDQYKFIVTDYGNLFDINNNGVLNFESMQSKKILLPEFFRSDYKVGMGFSVPWHVGKYKFFMEHEMFRDKIHDGSYLFIFDDDVKKIISRYGFNRMFDRSDFKVDELASLIIPEMSRTKPKRLFKFGLRA